MKLTSQAKITEILWLVRGVSLTQKLREANVSAPLPVLFLESDITRGFDITSPQ